MLTSARILEFHKSTEKSNYRRWLIRRRVYNFRRISSIIIKTGRLPTKENSGTYLFFVVVRRAIL